jgi:hypothetical protein
MKLFYPGVKCLVTKQDTAECARVFVPNVEDAKKIAGECTDNWADLATQGWWMVPDCPEQLVKLEARARAFVRQAKEQKMVNKKAIGYVEIGRGFISKGGNEILPLFLIPPQAGGNWEPLFELFVKRVVYLQDSDVLAGYTVDNNDFQVKWMEKAGSASLKLLAADVRAIRAVESQARD